MSITPAWKDREMIKGTTKIYELVIKEDGVAIDITDWTFYFTLKENISDSDANAKLTKKITTHTLPGSGETEIELSPSDTSSLDAGSYYYSMDYKDDEGNIEVFQRGRMTLIDPVLQTKG